MSYSIGGDCLDVILLFFSACLPGLERLNLSYHINKSMSHKEETKKRKILYQQLSRALTTRTAEECSLAV